MAVTLIMEAVSSSDRWPISTRLHSATSEKMAVFILVTKRTSDLSCLSVVLVLGNILKVFCSISFVVPKYNFYFNDPEHFGGALSTPTLYFGDSGFKSRPGN
jgi:hypothetical protein